MPSRFELRLGEDDYPPLLSQAPDPPEILYGVGNPAALAPGLAVVGARKATPYGLAAARLLAGWAGRSGYTVVSGGANGCDQAAHRAALEAGAPTVAVMGGGADVTYPASAGRLLDRIAESGAVISELPWGTRPQRWTFRARNRIIAGLCPVLLVLEASLPSGTFSTADFAADAGRTVAVVPGSIFAPECRGSNRLLRSGAMPITDVSELAELLLVEIGPPARDERPWEIAGGADADDELLSAVLANPMRPDDLVRTLSLDIVSVSRRLGALEARGLVAKYRDGRYGPC